MKLKQFPEDFRVEEITCVRGERAGPFAFYLLEKRGWTTPDALALIRRRWQIEPSRLSYGGLKDRHAHTTQHLTILHGPQRGLRQQQVALQYLGQTNAPFTSQDIEANRFRITLRALTVAEAEVAQARLTRVASEGVPNYFDDQRFGSVAGPGGVFIARLLIEGRFEEAVRLALTGPYEFDRASEKAAKQILRTHWGEWDVCKARLGPGHARSLIDYLRLHPGNFRGAVERLRPELRGLYLSAYQSHLWNRMLARWLQQHCRAEQLRPLHLRLGDVPVHEGLDPQQQNQLAALALPLPSARWKPEPTDPHVERMREVLTEEGLERSQLEVPGSRTLFFSRGERPALCLPRGVGAQQETDERHRGRQRLEVRFDLPRGAYATLVVKRIVEGPGQPSTATAEPDPS
jgi:tRNA pseudouridine13 synthase